MCHTDISDETRQRPEPFLPLEGSPRGGRPARDKRTFMNAIIRLPRTGAPRRALPEEHGSWNAVYSRFRRWQTKGSRKAVFLAPASAPDLEAVMIDGTCIHAHKHSTGARGGQHRQAPGRSRGGFTSRLHARADAPGNPVSFFPAGGECADISVARQLPEGVRDCTVIADKGHDSEPLVQLPEAGGCTAVIPPRSNRETPRRHDRHPYKERHLAECFFSKIKEYRRVATRYEKLSQTFLSFFLSFVYLAASMIWIR